MKKLILMFCTLLLVWGASAQVVGKTVTEDYKASFEKKSNIDSLLEYDGPKIPIQILSLGINEYPKQRYCKTYCTS